MTVNIDASLEFIFPTPIVKATLPLDAQDILESYYAPHIPTTKMGRVTKQNDEDQKTDYGSQRRYDLHPIINDALRQLGSGIIDTLLTPEQVNVRPEDYEISHWMQDYSKGEHHTVHNHNDAIVSGIYILRSNDLGEPLTLMHPDPVKSYTSTHDIWYKLPPTRGALYLWPGWINHFVSPQKDDRVIRTTLVFNIGRFPLLEEN